MVNRKLLKLSVWPVFLILCGSGSSLFGASAAGQLSALVLDESGTPLGDVLVSLLERSTETRLPTLARTDDEGRVRLTDLEAGTYQLLVRSGFYRTPAARLVEILPDRTAVVTLILQHVLAAGEDAEENLGVKALFRASGEDRLIFRHTPGYPTSLAEGRERLFEDAVFQVYTNGGVGSDYFVFPGDSWTGTTTNFAVVRSMGAGSEYVVAGQLNSGEDSIWRIKNLVSYELGDRHSLKLFMGYGRISYDQPSLALLGDPGALGGRSNFAQQSSTTNLLNVGFEDELTLAPTLSFSWGLDVDQVNSSRSDLFVSPRVAVEYQPFERTFVDLRLSSKRETLGNTLFLPEGEMVSLASPLYLSRINHENFLGTRRHWNGSVTQYLTEDSHLEFALFQNAMEGGHVPIAGLSQTSPGAEILRLGDDLAETRGFRVTFSRSLGESLKAEVALIRGSAPGLASAAGGFDSTQPQLERWVERDVFTAVATQFEAYVPQSGTHVTAMVKFVPEGNPLVTLDQLGDVYETGNESVNVFLRQVLPLPDDLLRFFGLDFLTPRSIEALLDIRNFLNDNLGVIETSSGELILHQHPRSFRGGVSFKF